MVFFCDGASRGADEAAPQNHPKITPKSNALSVL